MVLQLNCVDLPQSQADSWQRTTVFLLKWANETDVDLPVKAISVKVPWNEFLEETPADIAKKVFGMGWNKTATDLFMELHGKHDDTSVSVICVVWI
jgi:hypothetical protein